MVEAVIAPQPALADDGPGAAVPDDAADGQAVPHELLHGDERARGRETGEAVDVGDGEAGPSPDEADRGGPESRPVAPGHADGVAPRIPQPDTCAFRVKPHADEEQQKKFSMLWNKL